jgi:hypothetical protein
VVREGVEEGGEMTQTLYAHMNKKNRMEEEKVALEVQRCE